ncbi:C39 family peptidase [Candidatus Saccharibacteria bacterium]|nr:C39 family peptidase [Candidatus Saccharibacteria bacterium]
MGIIINVSPASALVCPASKSIDLDQFDATRIVDGSCGSVPNSLKKYLLDAGYNETAASGIMGNIDVESCGYNLRVYNNSCNAFAPDDFTASSGGRNTFSGGYGLAQWTSPGRVKNLQDYADSLGKSVNTLDVQAAFLVKELKSSSYRLNPSTLNPLSLEQVTWLIMRDYETPATVICTVPEAKCNNQLSPRRVSLRELLNNKSNYASAYVAYVNRLAAAKAALTVSTAECSKEEESTDPFIVPSTDVISFNDVSDSNNNDDSSSSSSDDDSSASSAPVSVSTSGALGASSAGCSKYYCQDRFKSTVWRTDGSTIFSSGCSLVSVANAAKYLGVSNADPDSLASWSKSRISQSQTSWSGSVTKLISHAGLTKTGYLWSNYNTSTSAKVQEIREVLAKGGVVIAAGDRTKGPVTMPGTCTSKNGECVFSPNGHFVTIIGITSSGKLVITNPAKANGNTSGVFDADAVLKFSNKAIGVYQ